MKTVGDVLRVKGSAVFAADPDDTVYYALTVMAEKNIGALVVREGERVVGIFSERDYARQVVLKGKASKDTPIRDVMTSRVVFVRPEQDLEECMALMTDKRIRHLPVLDDGNLIGILSIGDVVKAVISEKEFLISQLENYISSGG
jgi:CBS domain-containing protein